MALPTFPPSPSAGQKSGTLFHNKVGNSTGKQTLIANHVTDAPVKRAAKARLARTTKAPRAKAQAPPRLQAEKNTYGPAQ